MREHFFRSGSWLQRSVEPALLAFERIKGLELLGCRDHSPGFDLVRAGYINTRVRFLALLFALLTPLWIPIDYLILPERAFLLMVVTRLIFSGSLFLLWLLSRDILSLAHARYRLVVLMVMPALFHLSTQLILGASIYDERLASYTFLPFLIIAIHCVFPLTLKEGSLLALFTIFALSLDELIQAQLFTLVTLNHFWLLAVIMGIAIWAQLSQLHMQIMLFEQAAMDTLTGLQTRRAFMAQAEAELLRAERYNRTLVIAVLDLDHFKSINDTYGHLAGDKVLVAFSKLLKKALRSTDIVGRYGGEEFVIILPETALDEAEKVLQRILKNCRESRVLFNSQEVRFTASAGLGELLVDVQSSIQHADDALYKAKEQGRDRVVLAQSLASTPKDDEESSD